MPAGQRKGKPNFGVLARRRQTTGVSKTPVGMLYARRERVPNGWRAYNNFRQQRTLPSPCDPILHAEGSIGMQSGL